MSRSVPTLRLIPQWMGRSAQNLAWVTIPTRSSADLHFVLLQYVRLHAGERTSQLVKNR